MPLVEPDTSAILSFRCRSIDQSSRVSERKQPLRRGVQLSASVDSLHSRQVRLKIMVMMVADFWTNARGNLFAAKEGADRFRRHQAAFVLPASRENSGANTSTISAIKSAAAAITKSTRWLPPLPLKIAEYAYPAPA